MSQPAAAAAADPDRVWFYLDAAQQQQGPVAPFDLADLLADRDINSATLGSARRTAGKEEQGAGNRESGVEGACRCGVVHVAYGRPRVCAD